MRLTTVILKHCTYNTSLLISMFSDLSKMYSFSLKRGSQRHYQTCLHFTVAFHTIHYKIHLY